jgi:hypothetical protein
VLTAHRLSWLSFPTIEIWDPETGRQILTMPGRDALVFSAQFSPDSLRLLTGSADYTARQWEAFPWREEDYFGDSAAPFLQRVQLHAREYWRRRLDAERSAIRAATPSISSESLRPPRNEWPSRDGQVDARLIDLTGHYNAFLNFPAYLVSYELDFDNDLSALPTGVLTLSNTVFDVRGAILLQAAPRPIYSIYEKRFLPEAVRGIPVNARFRRFHLLHTTQNATAPAENTPVYACVLHYADGERREIEILFGRDVRDWCQLLDDSKPETDRGFIVWRGTNSSATRQGATLRLYKTTFDNPRPGIEVRSLDLVSRFAKGNPFLIAVTIDP